MPYELGVDIGTTWTAAALHRDGRVEMVTLGDRSPMIPSVVVVAEDGSVLVGESAERRAASEPDRVAREFKRRVGDPTPLVLGGAPWSAEALTAKLLRFVVDAATEREGEAPTAIAVTHPTNWGPYKLETLSQAITLAGLAGAMTLSEPEAAARWYASTARVDPGEVVAVYDLGGGTFDAAVLRKSSTGFELLGQPEGIEHLGGADFDQAVLDHVRRALGGALEQLDPADPAVVAAGVELRRRVTEAKEALTHDTDASIFVLLPTVQTQIRLTRAELEAMLRGPLTETVASLRRALDSAGVSSSDLRALLLVGGSSRIPLVAQLISSELGVVAAVDAHPKFAVAYGAALAAAGSTDATLAAAEPTEQTPAELVAVPEVAPAAAFQPVSTRSRGKAGWRVAAIVVALAAVGAVALVAVARGGRTASTTTTTSIAGGGQPPSPAGGGTGGGSHRSTSTTAPSSTTTAQSTTTVTVRTTVTLRVPGATRTP
ncbi:MAG: Hsp70 family protein [Acidimicrobiales bacterium]